MQQSYVERSHQEIEHPVCANCGAPMWLTRIEVYDADHDQRMFECQACNKSEIEIFKIR